MTAVLDHTWFPISDYCSFLSLAFAFAFSSVDRLALTCSVYTLLSAGGEAAAQPLPSVSTGNATQRPFLRYK